MMRLIFFLIVFLVGPLAAETYVTEAEMDARFAVLERNVEMLAEKCQHDMDLEKRLWALEVKMTDTQGREDGRGDDFSIFDSFPQLNDTNLEERVQALEFQIENVHDDITSLNTGLSDLNEDVEAQFILIEEELTVVNEQLTIIFDEIFQLADEVDNLSSNILIIEETIDGLLATDSELMDSIDELDSRVTILELLNGTDEEVVSILIEHEAEINSLNMTTEGLRVDITNTEETIVTLQQSDEDQEVELSNLDERVTDLESQNGTNGDVEDALNDLDERLSELEVDGTFAFHAELQSYSSIPAETPVAFDGVNFNLGDGYDETTGLFTVPPGGDGLYYFYTHLQFLPDEYSNFIIRLNGDDLCDVFEDNDNGDYGMSSCGAAVVLEEGKSHSLCRTF